MKKKCLFFIIALTAATAVVRAQKTVTDYEGLKNAVEKVNTIPALTDTVAKRKAGVTAAENNVTAAQRTVSEKELAVKEKQAVVKEKEKLVTAAQGVVAEKEAAVTPYKEALAEKEKATGTAAAVVSDWEKKISDLEELMAKNQYDGTTDEKSPQANLMINFSQALLNRMSEEPAGFTDEELAGMKLYYRLQRTATVPYIYSMYVTVGEVAEKQSSLSWKFVTADIDLTEIPRIKYNNTTSVKKVNLYVSYLDGSDVKSIKVSSVTSVAESDDEGGALYFSELVPDFEDCGNKIPLISTPKLNPNYPNWEKNLATYKAELGTKAGVESGKEYYTDANGDQQETKEQLLKDAQAEQATAQAAVDAADAVVKEAQKDVEAAKKDVETAQDDVDAAEAAVTEAEKAVITAQGAVATAKSAVTAAEDAVTEAGTYKKLTITGDNSFVVTSTLAEEWPADGVIRGNGNKIVNDANTPLFGHNYGSISNLIAPDGRIASYNETGAQVRDCIVKVSANEFRAYDNDGAVKTYSTLPDAVYSMREYFGYDATAATATGKMTSNTKLYKAQNKVASDMPMTASYVNITDAGEVRYGSSVSTENTVLYLDDIAVKSDNKNVEATNVAVLQSEVTDTETGAVSKTYSCKKVELVDGSSKKEFYMPYSVTADELSYSRTTTTNKVPVCMPFELNDGVKQLIAENVGTEVGNVFFYTLSEVKDGVVWFTPQSVIEANKPGLIAFKEGVELDGKANLFAGLTMSEVKATPALASLSASPLNGGDEGFFGNYKPGQVSSVLVQAHAGAGNVAYCYQGGQLVRMKEDAGGSTKLNQFRSYVIMKEPAATPNSLPDSFEIGFLDEDGNEVTGIGSVESGKIDNGFKAVGGNGVIEINAEKACEVKVYTAGGSLVKAVRVESGRTTLPFSAGMYIVNQTKVVVK